jgi:hypothetical protein
VIIEHRAELKGSSFAGCHPADLMVFIGSMKTTIDLPDELLREAEVLAARRNTTFRELVIEGLQDVKKLGEKRPLKTDRRAKAAQLLAALQAQNVEPMVPMKRDEIYHRGLSSTT